MADRKITDLTALPAGNQATGDLLTIVDVSEGAAVDKNKKIAFGDLLKGIPFNVGIGISTPGTHLVVQQNNIHDPNFHEDDDAAILIKNVASGSGGKSVIKLDNEAALVYGDGSSNLIFSDLSNERMRIDSSGNVAIGGFSPSHRLDVKSAGAGQFFINGKNSAGTDIFQVYESSVGDGRNGMLYIYNGSGSNDVKLSTNGASFFNGGNVGIGTSSPSSKAHVKGGSLTVEHASPNTGTGQVNINVENSSQATFSYDDEGSVVFGTSTDPSTQAGFSERMRLDSSGRLGIKNSSPGSQYFNDLVIGDGTSDHGITLHAGSSNSSAIAFSDATSGTGRYAGYLQYDHGSNSFRFYLNGGNEHMRLDSAGQALFYSTGNPITSGTSGSAGTTFEVFTGVHSRSSTTSGGTVSVKIFSNGNIQNTNNSYGQISDVKLKENIVNANSQWDDIKGIQVRNFNFKEETGSPTHTQIGVVAQELETVSPGLVYETPDTDDEGNDLGTVTKSVNYSVLYMKAVKALQEAMDRIETLEAKVAALEAQ